jgi:hypothetical protein
MADLTLDEFLDHDPDGVRARAAEIVAFASRIQEATKHPEAHEVETLNRIVSRAP